MAGRASFSWPYVVDPDADPAFPEGLTADEHGLVAVGGNLSERLLLEAYGKGIFPWFVGPPVMWFSPDPRLVLYPGGLHVSRRLARTLRQGRYTVELDRDFEEVMLRCATVARKHEDGTWIDAHFLRAYTSLHRRYVTHCVAVYQDGELCGGLYGLTLGRVFFGESMFALRPDASKVALYHLVRWLERRGFHFIDCQARTEHLVSLGAVEIPRKRFLEELRQALAARSHHYRWQLDPPDGGASNPPARDGGAPGERAVDGGAPDGGRWGIADE